MSRVRSPYAFCHEKAHARSAFCFSCTALATVSSLLGVDAAALATVLTQRTISDTVQRNLSAAQATDVRDALAKELYHRLWNHLLDLLNEHVRDKEDGGSASVQHIGVLDIFGFEHFPVRTGRARPIAAGCLTCSLSQSNSFEQLCINYANERLHQFFNHKLFQQEQEEYKAEDISWKYIDFNDNKDTIALLTKRPTGIFYLVDECCLLQNMTDALLLGKIRSEWGSHKCIQKPSQQNAQTHFIIKHYAAAVEYSVTGFIAKNTDTFNTDMLACLRTSQQPLIKMVRSLPARFLPRPAD